MVDPINPSFDLQPTLDGALVRLRPLRVGDFPALYAVASDPLMWAQHPASNRWQEDVFRDFFREAIASGGAFLVADAADGRVIGSSRYAGYDPAAREVEIGWTFLARSHWGGRYNREMKQLMLRHAFAFVDRVVFVIGASNIRSQRAVEKIGAIRAGSRADDAGGIRLVYEITADAFVDGRAT
jgi:RimJ/RimL family protein N-acetyltransferase